MKKAYQYDRHIQIQKNYIEIKALEFLVFVQP